MPKNILLCDDEFHILRAAEFKLKRSGFDVRCACDGEEAWQMIQERAPDILVTDCYMPRLDGLGLVERIRANLSTADLPVVMLTAKGFELAEADVGRRLGVLAVLAKPFSPRELVLRVQQFLETGTIEHSICR